MSSNAARTQPRAAAEGHATRSPRPRQAAESAAPPPNPQSAQDVSSLDVAAPHVRVGRVDAEPCTIDPDGWPTVPPRPLQGSLVILAEETALEIDSDDLCRDLHRLRTGISVENAFCRVLYLPKASTLEIVNLRAGTRLSHPVAHGPWYASIQAGLRRLDDWSLRHVSEEPNQAPTARHGDDD